MRINRESLLRVVRDTVERRTRADRSILAVYLHGSLLEEDYLLGGATDIDLFFVHTDAALPPREIVHLTDEVHLDIAHHEYRDYRNPRQLRLHPWMGPAIKSFRIQYDPQHFLDFTQASVRGQYDQPEFVVVRSREQLEKARQMWASLHEMGHVPGVQEILLYLKALEHTANAIASLNGPQLTDRRFLLRAPMAFAAIGRPGLYAGLLGLLGAARLDAAWLKAALPAWESAYLAVPAIQCPARLHPARLHYYRNALTALGGGSQPQNALWPLLRTWSLAIAANPEPGEHFKAWSSSLEGLDLLGERFSERCAGLDSYLDLAEETLEDWAAANGASLE